MSEFQFQKFLMFGDSITELAFNQSPPTYPFEDQSLQTKINFSFGSKLIDQYVRKLQVLNRGLSGYTSELAIHLLPKLLHVEHDSKPIPEQIKIAYIFLGTNDARASGKLQNTQHVPLQRYIENMKFLINEFQSRKIKLIVITPGLHDSAKWDKVDPQDLATGDYRSNELNEQYATALVELCNTLDVPSVNLFKLMKESVHSIDELLTDGIHFTGEGYQVLFDGLMDSIRENYQDCDPENMKTKFPLWRDASPDSLKKLL